MAIAYLDWSLEIECSGCDAIINLADQDDDAVYASAIFHNNWEALHGIKILCDHCGHEFILDSVEY